MFSWLVVILDPCSPIDTSRSDTLDSSCGMDTFPTLLSTAESLKSRTRAVASKSEAHAKWKVSASSKFPVDETDKQKTNLYN